ncbi:MAG: glutamine synthetase type III, partial [Muribaculaceae bacterium]|nr:glutamine synthetase type III [Muribaculaceae bacterium]
GYSDEWKVEAKRRGLDVESSAPLMFASYLWPSSVEMFEKAGLFNKKELEARNEVKWEMYSKKLQIESRVLGDLAINHIIPAAITYQRLLLDNVYKVKELFDGDTAKKIGGQDMASIEKLAGHLNEIKFLVEKMIKERHIANRKPSEREKAIAYHDNVAPLMEEIRHHIDSVELMVDNEIWPLPKYRELLFIR